MPDGNAGTQKHMARMKIKMHKLHHFINKMFANGFCLVKNSKLKMYYYLFFLIYLTVMKI